MFTTKRLCLPPLTPRIFRQFFLKKIWAIILSMQVNVITVKLIHYRKKRSPNTTINQKCQDINKCMYRTISITMFLWAITKCRRQKLVVHAGIFIEDTWILESFIKIISFVRYILFSTINVSWKGEGVRNIFHLKFIGIKEGIFFY